MRLRNWAFGLVSPATALAQSIPAVPVTTISIGVCLSNGSTGGYGVGGGGNGTGGNGIGGSRFVLQSTWLWPAKTEGLHVAVDLRLW